MRHPDHVSSAYDILYVAGCDCLNRERIQTILDAYNSADYTGHYATQIRAISYDGSLQIGAWVNCDRGDGEWGWLYIAAGDRTNRQLIAQAASEAQR